MGKIIVARSNSPRSVSMTPSNADYYDSLTKGHKSAMVNRAMDNYRGEGFSTHELLANIEGLQEVIAEMHDEASIDGYTGPVAPNQAPQRWHRRVISTLKRWFHI